MDETQTEIEDLNSNPEETPGGILIAEQLAYAQTELEHELAGRSFPENLEPEVDAILERYPAAREYKPFFIEVFKAYKNTGERIENYWVDVLKPSEAIGPSLTFPSLVEANLDGSRRAAEQLLRVRIGGDIRMLKGKYTLAFIVNSKDFDRMYRAHFFGDKSQEISDGYIVTARDMPTLVLRDRPDDELTYNYIHEQSHAEDLIFQVASDAHIDKGLHRKPGTISRQGVKRLIKNWLDPTEQESIIKQEIMAYFTIAELQDAMSSIDHTKPDRTRDQVEEFIVDIIDESKKEGAAYNTPKDPLVRKGQEAAKAFANIRQYYMQSSEAFVADKIVVNLLQQFPLKSWHVVAKMLFDARDGQAPPALDLKW